MADIRSFRVTVTPITGEVLVLAVRGEIDADTKPAVSRRLRGALTASPRPGLVVLDLSAVEFFAAAGLHVVIELDHVCHRRGLPLRIVVPPGSLAARVVAIACLADVIPIFATLAQALRARAA